MDEINFIGIGAGRSGTTWVVNMLNEHPEIFMPEIKKLNYFTSTRPDNIKGEYEKSGIKGYLKLFQDCGRNKKVKGEFSSYYMVNSKVAKIIKKHFPNIKLWACLRNPVDRAYSDWLACKRFKLKENCPFEIAFFKDKNPVYRKGDGYRARGYYYKQLKPYFDLFPKKNIKIVLQEDIIKSPEKIAREFYEFLGVDENFKPPSLKKKINKSTETKYKFLRKFINLIAEYSHKLERGVFGRLTFILKRKTKLGKIFNKINDVNVKDVKKPKLNPKIKERLKKEYLEDIKKLEKLINRKLDSWK